MSAQQYPKSGSAASHPEEEDNRVRLEDVLPKDAPPWWKRKNLRTLNFLLLCPVLSSTISGYDSSMLNGLQSQTQWKVFFDYPKGYRLGNLSAAPTFGHIVGAWVAAFLSDRFGRKWTIGIGTSITIVGAIVQCFAQSYGAFFAARFVIGFGNTICINPSPSLLSELSYPTHRGFVTATYNIMWYSGAILAAWITYGTYWMGETNNWSWRIPSLLQASFPIMQIILLFFVPESPRYLIFKDRLEEARNILVKYHAEGDAEDPLVDFEFNEIFGAIQHEKTMKNVSYLVFFKKNNRLRLFISMMVPFMQQMSGNGLVSYYLSLVLNSIGIRTSPEQLVINGGLMIYNLGICIILNMFVTRFPRRKVFLTSTGLMCLVYILWTILSAINQQRNFEDPSLGKGVLALIFLFYFAYNIGLMGLPYVYLTEVLPYYLRSRGIGIALFTSGLCQLYNGYVNSIAMDAIEWKYYIVYCCVIFMEFLAVFFFFPETKGRTLEEVAEVFEGKNADVYQLTTMKKSDIVETEEV
ncbi:general substrate transporter [Dipodascopsis uninucleata]